MKQVLIIYDDREQPAPEIREITGGNSFGSTIYKRRTLREIQESLLSPAAVRKVLAAGGMRVITGTEEPDLKGISQRTAVFHIFSDCAVRDEAEFWLLLRKAAYSGISCRIPCGRKPAALLFSSLKEWQEVFSSTSTVREMRTRAEEYEAVENAAFADLSDRDTFLKFITSGFEARFFNSISGDSFTVVKKSANIKKIHAEYQFYRLLPDRMKSWFVLPYDYREENGQASYAMERYHMTDLSIRYVHGAIDIGEFRHILAGLFRFLETRSEKDVSWNEFYGKRKDLYIGKVERRVRELKEHPGFPTIERYIACGTQYSGIDAIVAEYETLYDRMIAGRRDPLKAVIGHGDLCFSNILYAGSADLLRFIDPKGAETEAELYTDPLYDIAKLSHSIAGGYDFMNSGLYEIVMDEELKLSLRIDGELREYTEIFREELVKRGYDWNEVRLFECSLFLSMLPLHMDRPQKVMAFILNAVNIMKGLRTE